MGRFLSLAPRGEIWWEEDGDSESEGGGRAGPALGCLSLCLSLVRLPLVRNFFLGAPFPLFFLLSFLWGVGGPTMNVSVGLRPGKNGYIKKPTTVGGAAAMAHRAACSGIANKKQHTQPMPSYSPLEVLYSSIIPEARPSTSISSLSPYAA